MWDESTPLSPSAPISKTNQTSTPRPTLLQPLIPQGLEEHASLAANSHLQTLQTLNASPHSYLTPQTLGFNFNPKL